VVTRSGLATLATGLAAALLPAMAFAITPDELRQLVRQDEQIERARAARVQSAEPDALIPDRPAAAPRSVRPPQPARYNGSVRWPPAASGGLLPGAGAGSAAPIFSDAVAIDATHAFGIRLGTWMRARLAKHTSSAEPGLAELVLTHEVAGDHRTLPAGTLLFARTQINGATQRMEMLVEKGITPDGREFRLKGLVFDPQKTSGLDGIVTADHARMVRRGTGKGMLAAGGAAVSVLFGNSGPAGAAAGAATNSILNDTGRLVDRSTQQTLTIYVAPQPVLIRVEATF